ncbi:excisionase family DNA-binding protein [Nonomuraea sp. NPDC050786]|uniref:excisionase family DNA-binding protein n=1 Tax=Nonomuraea sp. NPDC050786 TaxID=3154840 RepID=UPI0033CC6D7F
MGVVEDGGRFYNAYSDGTQIPVVLGGSIDTVVDLPLLMTVDQARKQLSLGRTQMFALIKSGELESVVLGVRGRRVPRQAVLDFVTRLRNQAPEA